MPAMVTDEHLHFVGTYTRNIRSVFNKLPQGEGSPTEACPVLTGPNGGTSRQQLPSFPPTLVHGRTLRDFCTSMFEIFRRSLSYLGYFFRLFS